MGSRKKKLNFYQQETRAKPFLILLYWECRIHLSYTSCSMIIPSIFIWPKYLWFRRQIPPRRTTRRLDAYVPLSKTSGVDNRIRSSWDIIFLGIFRVRTRRMSASSCTKSVRAAWSSSYAERKRRWSTLEIVSYSTVLYCAVLRCYALQYHTVTLQHNLL